MHVLSWQSPATPRQDERLFTLGRLRTTLSALRRLSEEDIRKAATRHASGDWGDVSEEDWQENEFSLRGLRLFSVYHDRDGTEFWVITEADRSQTTVLLPEDCEGARGGRSANPPAEMPTWGLGQNG